MCGVLNDKFRLYTSDILPKSQRKANGHTRIWAQYKDFYLVIIAKESRKNEEKRKDTEINGLPMKRYVEGNLQKIKEVAWTKPPVFNHNMSPWQDAFSNSVKK